MLSGTTSSFTVPALTFNPVYVPSTLNVVPLWL